MVPTYLEKYSGALSNLMPYRRSNSLGALQNLDNQKILESHRFFNYPTDTLDYISNNPKAYTEAEQRIASQILSLRPPIIDPMSLIGAPDGSGGM
tara:strand:- start:285 stop:569 length:285 start_codon:yes stop_codon:yes gene_type:complete